MAWRIRPRRQHLPMPDARRAGRGLAAAEAAARNFSSRGMKGEIDLVGYDGAMIAFVEVKTRTSTRTDVGSPEDAVTQDKQRHLSRVARQFLREYRAGQTPFRFDILALEAPPGQSPVVRLHKGAFSAM